MTDAVPLSARPLRRAAVIVVSAVVGAAALLVPPGPIIRAAPLGEEPVRRPTSRPAEPRPLAEIDADLVPVLQEVDKNQPPADAFFDAAKRAEAAGKALPAMRKLLPLLDERIAAVDKDFGNDTDKRVGMVRMRVETVAIMSLLGDADGLKELQATAESTSREERVNAQAWLYGVEW